MDSDWANSPDRKSTSGFVFFINSCLVVWYSKKQVTIATSTTVAEYFAMYEATTEAVCLRNLLDDLQIPQKGPTLLREDNQKREPTRGQWTVDIVDSGQWTVDCGCGWIVDRGLT